MKYVERAVIGLFSTIALAALIWVFVIAITNLFESNGWVRLTASDWGAWVGAVGTVGALFGAIWIATEERRQRQRLDHDLAVIVAARVFLTIVYLRSAIRNLERDLVNHQKNGASIDLSSAATTIEELGRLQTDDLFRLSVLPNRVAAKLAIADGLVDHFTEQLRQLARPEIEDEPRGIEINRLLAHIEFASKAFTLGVEECKNALRLKDVPA